MNFVNEIFKHIADLFIKAIINKSADYKDRINKKENIIMFSHKFLFSAILLIFVFGSASLLPLIGDNSAGVIGEIVFILLFIAGLIMLIAYKNYKIEYTENTIIKNNIFGKEETYYFSNLTEIITKREIIILIFADKKLKISTGDDTIGGNDFLTFLIKNGNDIKYN